MDARSRASYAPAHPLPLVPPQHPSSHPPPPPHPTTYDSRPPAGHVFSPPPPPAYPPPPPSAAHPPYGPPPPPSASGVALPPIHAAYATPGAPPDQQHHLPSFRHPHEAPRDAAEHHLYNQHNHSGHVTPAPVNRSFSVDSTHQQRTPTTPAQPGHYPSAPPVHGTAPPPPQPHSMEHVGHYQYPPPNGVPHGLPPAPPPPPQHEAHHYAAPVMDNHHPYPPSTGPPISYSSNYGPASVGFVSGQKRKQMRATQACEQCRQRKQKCDEGTPCSFCKEQNLTCQYRDTPPVKTDKNMERVLQSLESLVPTIDEMSRKLDNVDQRLQGLERDKRLHQTETDTEMPDTEPRTELDDHRTAPHKLLLLWPSVNKLLEDAGVHAGESYVIEAEDRGILRIYTRGEGIDEGDGTQPGGAASPARSEDSGDGNAPNPPDGLWGTGLPNTPSGEIRRSEPLCEGGLKPDGLLDLDMATMNKLFDSYMKSFHRMHPFLDKGRLRKLFDRFIKRYSTGNPSLRKFVAESASDQERPTKRQRSNGSTSVGVAGSEGAYGRREPTERSPGNAIVWLVLALGKICLHKGPLPGAVPDSKLNSNLVVSHQASGSNGITASSPLSAAVRPSPMSPKPPSSAQQTPPGIDGRQRPDNRSRRSSIDAYAGARNMDIIPGLAYYAKAAEILGDQGDGNDLVHAQMFLLAGLYKGQLARVKESMSWISMAGRAIMMLLDRYKLYSPSYWTAYGDARKQYEKGQARIKDKRHSLIVLASWTCLQLESDILAELRLPSSGIQSIENNLLLPHNMPDEDKDGYEGLQQSQQQESADHESADSILLYYSAQLYLRRRLNKMHKEMYGNQYLNQSLNEVRVMLVSHEETLAMWRSQLRDSMQWADDAMPATDILAARLRAKYWGARYVCNRPFLDYCLHILPQMQEDRTVEYAAKDVYGNPRDQAEVHLFKAIATMHQDEVWQAAQRCVDCAMQSTVALDGVPDRLIVTNIHGTAHAQFGNMLVLAATWHTGWLARLVDKTRFQHLLERTIRFLRKLSAISPTCAHDCQILEKINNLLFGNVPEDARHFFRGELEPPSLPGSATTSFNYPT